MVSSHRQWRAALRGCKRNQNFKACRRKLVVGLILNLRGWKKISWTRQYVGNCAVMRAWAVFHKKNFNSALRFLLFFCASAYRNSILKTIWGLDGFCFGFFHSFAVVLPLHDVIFQHLGRLSSGHSYWHFLLIQSCYKFRSVRIYVNI